jgi:hypothetical protein
MRGRRVKTTFPVEIVEPFIEVLWQWLDNSRGKSSW